MNIHRLLYTCISLLCYLIRPESNDSPVTMSRPSTQILVSNTASQKRNQSPVEKWLTLEPWQEMYRMILEHLVVPESECSKYNTHTHTNWEACQTDKRSD